MAHLTEHRPRAVVGAEDDEIVCRAQHAHPALLGAIRGTDWWHCRSCGEVWAESQRSRGGGESLVVEELQAERS